MPVLEIMLLFFLLFGGNFFRKQHPIFTWNLTNENINISPMKNAVLEITLLLLFLFAQNYPPLTLHDYCCYLKQPWTTSSYSRPWASSLAVLRALFHDSLKTTGSFELKFGVHTYYASPGVIVKNFMILTSRLGSRHGQGSDLRWSIFELKAPSIGS